MNAVDQHLQKSFPRWVWWALFALVAMIVLSIRIRLLGIPLERDEGEYAYAGQLMLQGIPPYQLAYNMKFPGTYAAYALLMSIFGQTIVGVHLGLLFVNAATVVLIFFLGRRLIDEIGGTVAAASYAVLSVSPSVLGFSGHATHFVMLPVVGGALLLLGALDRQSNGKLFCSGTLFGLAMLMKQPGAAFLLFGVVYLLARDWRRGFIRTAIFIAGGLLPFAITCFLLWRTGVFEKFWFWTVQYAHEYGGRVSLSLGAEVFAYAIGPVIGASWAIWVIAALGLVACCWKMKSSPSSIFLLAFFTSSALAVCPGFYFRPHYFILALPALALLVGMAASIVSIFRMGQSAVLLGLAAALALPLYAERDFFFKLSLNAAARSVHGVNPFPECVRIAQFLRDHSEPGDTIAVLGSEPEIYFYAHRHSATGYIYTYPLMEPHQYAAQMQREMVQEIENARPKFIIYVAVDTSWLARADSQRFLLDWFADYSRQNLQAVGLANIVSADRTDYYLPYASESVTPSRYRIEIYERKS